MMNNWQNTTLGEVLTFQRGFDITKSQQQDGPYAVISSSGPQSTHNEFMVNGPGVVIGRKGTLGSVFYSENPFWPHDTTLWIKDFHGNNPKFAYYFLQTLHLEQYDAGASNPSLNRNHIHLLPVKYPPLPTQRRIADILSAYDDLIENNTRRIRVLEQMAQAIYQEWFGKMDKESLPKGWETKTISDLCEFISRGVTPKYVEGSQRYVINQKANRGSFIDVTNLKELDPELYVPEDKFARVEDVLINSLGEGTLGRVHFFLGPDNAWAVDQHMTICRSSQTGATLFIYFYLSSDEGQGRIESLKTGGTNMTMFNISEVRQFELIVPPENLLKKFYELINPLWQMKRTLELKNANLRQTRDLLLPRLVSGEIEVSKVEIEA